MRPEEARLLDVLIAGFEKNQVSRGHVSRDLPMPDEETAIRRYGALVDEAIRWKGQPTLLIDADGRRLSSWGDLEIRQAGRGVMLRVRWPGFEWWHEPEAWEGAPLHGLWAWLREEREEASRRQPDG